MADGNALWRSRRIKAVAFSPDVFDVAGCFRVVFNLFSQVVNVHGYRSAVAPGLTAPDLLIKLGSRKALAGMLNEEIQELGFHAQKAHGFSVSQDALLPGIEGKIRESAVFGLNLLVFHAHAAQCCLYFGMQNLVVKRLDQIVVSAVFQCTDDGIAVAQAADKENGTGIPLAQLCTQIDAVYAWQHDIQQDDILAGAGAALGLFGVLGPAYVVTAFLGEIIPDHAGDVDVVLNEQNTNHSNLLSKKRGTDMKRRYAFALLVFALMTLAFTVLMVGANGLTPVLNSGDALPTDVLSRQYAVRPQQMPDGGQRVVLACSDEVDDLTLTVADTDAIRVLQSGQVVYESTMHSRYLRAPHVPLLAELIRRDGQIDVAIYPMAGTGEVTEVLSGASLTPIKLIIGSHEHAQLMESVVFGLTMLTIGMYTVAFIICLTLYFGKRTETYLLMISLVCVICMITSIFKVNNPLIRITFEQYAKVRPLIALFPVMINAGICFFLCEECLPQRLRRWLSVRMLILLTVVLLFLRQITSFSFYIPVRFLMMAPIVYTLSHAYAKRMWGAGVMIIGHALGEAIVMTMFVVLNLRRGLPGPFMAYIETSQFSYLTVMLSALLVVSHRFAAKFRESEVLTDELTVMNRELDRRVEERTAQLLDEQQRRRNLMLNVIHDIRSPIFILRAYLQQLHTNEEDGTLLGVMNRKLDGLERLVEDLFMSSKLEDEGLFFEEERICLAELAGQIYEENEAEAKRRGIRLLYELETEAAPVWADPQRMRQAVQNLMDNAFTYTPEERTIRLRLKTENGKALLSVSDTGKGIAQQDLARVFDRYFSASRSDNPKSSGLGLSIARQIVQHMHGEIAVKSEPGKGTEFTICLPLLED